MLRVATPGGEDQVLARAVIDASGTWSSPNPLGAGGLPALGEATARDHVFYGSPDIIGRDRERYSGKRIAVVGSGHSAFNALLELAVRATFVTKLPTELNLVSVALVVPSEFKARGVNPVLISLGL